MTESRPCELLVLDLDGTLLDRAGRVSERNASALAAAESAGIPVVIATGRSWSESRHVLRELAYRRQLVASGGSVLADGGNGRTIERVAMPSPLVDEVVAALCAHGHPTLLLKDAPPSGDQYVVIGDGPLDPASQWWFDTFQIAYRRVACLGDDPHPQDTVRIGVVASGRALGAVVGELRETVGDRVFLQHWSAVTSTEATGSATHLLEIFSPQVNKWTMVARLCAELGIDPRRTVAFGDGMNDVELITNAGTGVAMANACAAVLDRADLVVGHHDEDSVGETIERLLDGSLRLGTAE